MREAEADWIVREAMRGAKEVEEGEEGEGDEDEEGCEEVEGEREREVVEEEEEERGLDAESAAAFMQT